VDNGHLSGLLKTRRKEKCGESPETVPDELTAADHATPRRGWKWQKVRH